MPQVDFFLAPADELPVIERVIRAGGWIVPDLRYETPEVLEIRSTDDYLDSKGLASHYFFLLPEVYRCPLELRRISSGPNSGKYFVVQKNGGPAIDFLCPPLIEREDRYVLPPGMIGYYKTYWDAAKEANVAVPGTLLDAYRGLVGMVKGSSHRVRHGSRTYRVGRDAQSRREQGEILLALIDT